MVWTRESSSSKAKQSTGTSNATQIKFLSTVSVVYSLEILPSPVKRFAIHSAVKMHNFLGEQEASSENYGIASSLGVVSHLKVILPCHSV